MKKLEEGIIVIVKCPIRMPPYQKHDWMPSYLANNAEGRLCILTSSQLKVLERGEEMYIGKNETSINYFMGDLRQATDIEALAYLSGIRNIKDIVITEQISIKEIERLIRREIGL